MPEAVAHRVRQADRMGLEVGCRYDLVVDMAAAVAVGAGAGRAAETATGHCPRTLHTVRAADMAAVPDMDLPSGGSAQRASLECLRYAPASLHTSCTLCAAAAIG